MFSIEKYLPAISRRAGLGPLPVFLYIASVFTAGAFYWLSESGALPEADDIEQIVGLLIATTFVYVALGYYVWHIFSKADQN